MNAQAKIAAPKRFYAAVDVQQNGDAFCIVLDGRNVRTPAGNLLACDSRALAEAIANEWRGQKETILTETMPLTRLLHVALDRVAQDRDALLQEIIRYGETDLVCYRVALTPGTNDEVQREIAAQQTHYFTPVLEWVKKAHGLEFEVTDGLMPVQQPEATLAILSELFAAADDDALAALSMLVPLLGSALLTLAVWQGEMDIEDALVAARIDEAAQEKKCGIDAEAAAKWAAKCFDARACAFFLTCK